MALHLGLAARLQNLAENGPSVTLIISRKEHSSWLASRPMSHPGLEEFQGTSRGGKFDEDLVLGPSAMTMVRRAKQKLEGGTMARVEGFEPAHSPVPWGDDRHLGLPRNGRGRSTAPAWISNGERWKRS